MDKKDTNAGGGGIRLMRSKGKGSAASQSETPSASSAGPTVSTEADMARLRTSIQSLVQHTGPLGTCMDFIQVWSFATPCRAYLMHYRDCKHIILGGCRDYGCRAQALGGRGSQVCVST